jgi:hypothetical protein
MSGERSASRDRQRPLKVFVDPIERAFILESAQIAGMSVSMYLRTVGMHGRPKNMLDLDAVREIIRVHGDLGRLGGLLKLWLSEQSEVGASSVEVRSVLHKIEPVMLDIRSKILSM